jgi:hypothetical protein
VSDPIRFQRASPDDYRASDPLRDFFTEWDRLTAEDVDALTVAVQGAEREEDIQSFLRDHPALLIQYLGGGHGRWVIPKQRLGAEHVTDFLIADRDSIGMRWTAVELESPRKAMFTKAGDPSSVLVHAVRQILNWREWLSTNRAYAVQSRDDHGLGLEGIDANLAGLIIIGRRGIGPDSRGLRRQLAHDTRIEIHSYDWLIDRTAGRRPLEND